MWTFLFPSAPTHVLIPQLSLARSLARPPSQVDSSHVAEQARWAKESLREVEETADERITRTELDRENVAEQAKWAVESLQSRQAEEVKVEYDAAAVAQQAQWAKESLEKRDQSVARTEFDASSVGEQVRDHATMMKKGLFNIR